MQIRGGRRRASSISRDRAPPLPQTAPPPGGENSNQSGVGRSVDRVAPAVRPARQQRVDDAPRDASCDAEQDDGDGRRAEDDGDGDGGDVEQRAPVPRHLVAAHAQVIGGARPLDRVDPVTDDVELRRRPVTHQVRRATRIGAVTLVAVDAHDGAVEHVGRHGAHVETHAGAGARHQLARLRNTAPAK